MSLPEWDDPDRRADALDRVADALGRYEQPTRRQIDVLRCLSHGMTEQMAADVLGIGHQTVRKLARQARSRLAAKTATHAVAVAIRRGLL